MRVDSVVSSGLGRRILMWAMTFSGLPKAGRALPMGFLVRNPQGGETLIAEMRHRLDEFYNTTTTYTAFMVTPDNSAYYRQLEPLIDQLLIRMPMVRVLELGSGRSVLADHLGGRRKRVHMTAQDITSSNETYLRERCDDVFIGDISRLNGPYDLILSVFAFEHVSAPGPWLANVDRLLSPGGWHVIFCPRYDAPGYVCPSLRHLPLARKLVVGAFLAKSRLAVIAGGPPAFWVNSDPAVFHTKWFRDADAVNLVSKWDTDGWHRSRGYGVRWLHLGSGGGLRGWILKRFLTISAAYQKPAASGPV